MKNDSFINQLDKKLADLIPKVKQTVKTGIALAGYAGSGKTVTADYLKSYHGFNVISFAAPLKQSALLIWGEIIPKPRRLLQQFGCTMRDLWGPSWIYAALRTIVDRGSTKVAIDDLRFLNEATILKEAGFTLVKNAISIEQCLQRLRARDGAADASAFEDISERSLLEFKDWDAILDQTRPFTEVTKDIDELVNTLPT